MALRVLLKYWKIANLGVVENIHALYVGNKNVKSKFYLELMKVRDIALAPECRYFLLHQPPSDRMHVLYSTQIYLSHF